MSTTVTNRFEMLFQSLVMYCDKMGYDITEWEMEHEEEPTRGEE